MENIFSGVSIQLQKRLGELEITLKKLPRMQARIHTDYFSRGDTGNISYFLNKFYTRFVSLHYNTIKFGAWVNQYPKRY